MNEMFRIMLNLPPQASSFAREIDILHYTIISISVFGWVLVLVTAGVFLLRWRRGAPRRNRGGHRSLPVWVEVAVLGGLLSSFIFVWAIGHGQYVHMDTPPKGSLDVYVVGKQWMWSFAYEDGSASNYDVYVPVGRPVRLLITSRDVIHSFYVPAFRIKQDAVPGRMTIAWFEVSTPGTYQVLCTEYCGLSHSRMRGRVVALTPTQFEVWQRERAEPALPELSDLAPLLGERLPSGGRSDLAAVGERVAGERGCLRCHTVDGTPHLGPTWARLYRGNVPLEGGGQVVADDHYLTSSMMEPLHQIHQGYAPIMPSYQGILSAGEVGALVAYIHSLEDRPVAEVLAPLPYVSPNPVNLPATQPGPAGTARGAGGLKVQSVEESAP